MKVVRRDRYDVLARGRRVAHRTAGGARSTRRQASTTRSRRRSATTRSEVTWRVGGRRRARTRASPPFSEPVDSLHSWPASTPSPTTRSGTTTPSACRGDPRPTGLDPGGRRRGDRPDRARRQRPERARSRPLRRAHGARRRDRAAATSPGSRRSSRTTPTSPACPRCTARTRSLPCRRSATATSPGCSSPPASSRWARPRLSEYGFNASAEHPRLGPSGRPGRPTTPRAPRPPGRRHWSPPAPSRSPTPTTGAARSASRRRSTGSSGSSPRGADWPRTGCCGRCRSGSWPTGW